MVSGLEGLRKELQKQRTNRQQHSPHERDSIPDDGLIRQNRGRLVSIPRRRQREGRKRVTSKDRGGDGKHAEMMPNAA